MGMCRKTVNLIKKLYENCETQYKSNNNLSSNISLNRGVKQGCPISMSIFCLCINFILDEIVARDLGGIDIADTRVHILAYADDIAIFAPNGKQMKNTLELLISLTDIAGLRFRPEKCGYMRDDMDKNTNLTIYGKDVKIINKDNLYQYLGVPMGGTSNKASLDKLFGEVQSMFLLIGKSLLSATQKIEAFNIFINSKLTFHLKEQNIYKAKLEEFDDKIRELIKLHILDLENSCPMTNDVLYAPKSMGGLGIICATDEFMVMAICRIYKLINSQHIETQKILKEELIDVAARRTNNTTDILSACKWLDGSNIHINNSNNIKTWLTRIRTAFLDIAKHHNTFVTFIFQQNQLCLKINSLNETIIITPNTSKIICKTLHDYIKNSYGRKWMARSCQGYIVRLVTSPSLEWKIPDFLPDVDFRFLTKARANSLNVGMCQKNLVNPSESILCRHGCPDHEGAPHVINHCPFGQLTRIAKHNWIQNVLANILMEMDINVEVASVPSECSGGLKPDLVVRFPDRIMVIDIKCPFDTDEAVDAARAGNQNKYQNLCQEIRTITNITTTLDTFVVCSLGTWDKRNNLILKKLGIPVKNFKSIKEKMTRLVIKGSRITYDHHRGFTR